MQRSRVMKYLCLFVVLLAAGTCIFYYQWQTERQFQSALGQAKDALNLNRPATALDRLTVLAQQRPLNGEVHYLIGLCEIMRQRSDQAEAAWVRIPPGDAHHLGLAAIRRADLDRERGRLADAENRLKAVFAPAGAPRPQLRWALVQLLILEGRKLEALDLYASGLADLSDPVEGLRTLYKTETNAFPLEAAQEYFASASRQAPDDDRVWLGQAHLAILAGDVAKAEGLLEQCLKRRPDDPPVLEMLLRGGEQGERPDLVLKAMRRLPADWLDEAQRNELRAWAARIAQNRNLERQALESMPNSTQALERLAQIEIEDGHADKAVALRGQREALGKRLETYLRRIGTAETATDPVEMARLAKEAGRGLDERYWSSRAGRSVGTGSANPSKSSAGKTLAEALPDLVSLLESRQSTSRIANEKATDRIRFSDNASLAGLKFTHQSGTGTSRLIPPLSFSGGVGLLDYDRDGSLDVYTVQSGRFPGGPEPTIPGDRLFRNRGDGMFEDVTKRAGLEGARGYGHGVTVGDIDNDGYPDLFVTRWRAYALYRNKGDGTFEDVTARWGLAGSRDWPTSAAFADLDADGDLDLYVCHYIAWDESDQRACVDPKDPTRFNCNPRDFPPLPDHLFRNDGGKFVDVTHEAGITDTNGRGLGVVAADVDGDNQIDLFVANDMSANLLFMNQGKLRFEERALEAGVAANASGGYQAGMGVACGDFNADGRLDLAVTNFYGESTSYFQNLGHGLFADKTSATGLLKPSQPLLGFGAAFLDADNDGQLDLLTANGHIHDGRPLYPWKMPLQLLQGSSAGRFTDVTSEAGPPFQEAHISRGLAVGDLDNDGRLDAIVQNQDEPLVLLHNETKGGNFIAFELEGTTSNRDGVGATVTVGAPDGKRRVAQRIGGSSYQSASSPILHVGLGKAVKVASVEVLWTSGQRDQFKELEANRTYRLREGSPEATVKNQSPTGESKAPAERARPSQR